MYALSHGLLSEPHISFTAVYPNPVRNLTIARVVDNRVTLSWLPPVDSLFTGYVIRWAGKVTPLEGTIIFLLKNKKNLW